MAEGVRAQTELALSPGNSAHVLLTDLGGGAEVGPRSSDGSRGAKEMIEDAAVVVLVGSPELAKSREALALVSDGAEREFLERRLAQVDPDGSAD